MKTWDKWIIEGLYVLIPGFVYVFAIFILIYTYVSDHALCLPSEYKDYLLVLFISILIVSYIIGSAMDQFVQRIIWFKNPKFKLDFINLIDKPEYPSEKSDAYFFGLVMVRHLFISMLLLCFASTMYFITFKLDKLGFSIAVVCFLLSIILLFNYLHVRVKLKLIQDEDYKKKTRQNIQNKINKKHDGTTRGIANKVFNGFRKFIFRFKFRKGR